ncbi:hypothetical protein NX865_29590, partial [Burkholderia thailandensis]
MVREGGGRPGSRSRRTRCEAHRGVLRAGSAFRFAGPAWRRARRHDSPDQRMDVTLVAPETPETPET